MTYVDISSELSCFGIIIRFDSQDSAAFTTQTSNAVYGDL